MKASPTIPITMDEKIKQLLKKYGNHNRVAEALGVTRRTWVNYRSTKKKLPKRAEITIDLLLRAK